MSAEHTPTPWHVWVDDSGGEFTGWPSVSADEDLDTTVVHRAGFKQQYWGDLSLRDTLANAEFIVRAVNAHDDLVAALKEAEAALLPFVRDLHALSDFAHNFGVVVNGPRTGQHLITLLASDFDRAITSSSLISAAFVKAAQS